MKINFLPDDLIRKYKVRLLNKSLFVVLLIFIISFSSFYTLKSYEKAKLVNEKTTLEVTLNSNISKSNELLNTIKSNELYGTLNANGKLDIENLLDNSPNNNLSYRFDNLLYYVVKSTPENALINSIKISSDKMDIAAQAEDFESMESMYLELNKIGLTNLENVKVNPLNEGSNMNLKESISFNLVTVFSEHPTEENEEIEEEKE